MATTIKIRGTSNDDEEVVLVGRALRPLTRITSLIRSRVIREVTLPIGEVVEEPEVTFTAELVAPSQLQESQNVQLSANLFSRIESGPLDPVEDYDPTHWIKAITSGGSSASLGGPNGDLLTATATPGAVIVEFTFNVAGHEAEGTVATATVEVVVTPTFNVSVTGLPASVIQGQSYTLGASRRDGVTGEVVDNNPANFTFTITSGGSFASITNGNQLNINPGTSGNSITVRATHNVGGEFGQGTANIVVQPQPGDFPDNEPAGMTQLIYLNGTSLSLPGGWNPGANWLDPTRIFVTSDPLAKFGQAIHVQFRAGDKSGWYAFIRHPNIGLFRELYFRFSYMLSSNWQYHGGTNGKLVYYNRSAGAECIILNEGWAWSDSPSSHPTLAPVGSDAWLRIGRQIPVPPGAATGNAQFGTQVPRGVYHTLECHHTAALTPGTGLWRMWIDGIERTSFKRLGQSEPSTHDLTGRTDGSTLNVPDKRIGRAVEMPFFWGGSGFTKAVDDFVRFSEIYISGRN